MRTRHSCGSGHRRYCCCTGIIATLAMLSARGAGCFCLTMSTILLPPPFLRVDDVVCDIVSPRARSGTRSRIPIASSNRWTSWLAVALRVGGREHRRHYVSSIAERRLALAFRRMLTPDGRANEPVTTFHPNCGLRVHAPGVCILEGVKQQAVTGSGLPPPYLRRGIFGGVDSAIRRRSVHVVDTSHIPSQPRSSRRAGAFLFPCCWL